MQVAWSDPALIQAERKVSFDLFRRSVMLFLICTANLEKSVVFPFSRRQFLHGSLAAGTLGLGSLQRNVSAQQPGERPRQDDGVKVLHPRMRVPLSFIVDDSTCLVNLNRFAIPQFGQAFKGERYHHDWRKMPDEIPDDFVRTFGNWCGEQGIKGKYSIVPYPACVGRVDRVLPGWTQKQLNESLKLVRTLMMPNWDIHPEMVTHTIVIDTRTGHPYRNPGLEQMENWRWADGKSVDQLADYMQYALTILKNVGLPCEGVTTPGGFGNRVLPELAQATLQSVKDVFSAEIPHYFRHVISRGDESVEPRVEYVSGLDGDDPQCVVSIIACTGDWTGGWDCSSRGDVDLFINEEMTSGRMVEVIERGEPAIMLCHWTGIYFNGEQVGFHIFQEAVRRMHARFTNIQWMKLSEIARYWAARKLTSIQKQPRGILLDAPFACPAFTLRVDADTVAQPILQSNQRLLKPRKVASSSLLKPGCWMEEKNQLVLCFDLEKGKSQFQW